MRRRYHHLLRCLFFIGVVCLSPLGASQADDISTIQRQSHAFRDLLRNTLEQDRQTRAHKAEAFLDAHFKRYVEPSTLNQLSSDDLSSLLESAFDFLYLKNGENPTWLAAAKRMAITLDDRGDATPAQNKSVVALLVMSRNLDQARQFAARHDPAMVDDIPVLTRQPSKALENTRYTALEVRDDGHHVSLRSVDLSQPQVVVVSSARCPFCAAAVRAINQDAELKQAMSKHSLWLAPPQDLMASKTVVRWNTEHPAEHMVVAYHASGWPFVKVWATPTFFFIQDGKVSGQVVGWPDSTQIDALRQGLTSIGLAR